MRLIDADKLLKFFTVDTANQTYRFGTVKKQIESAPTANAIPLVKIEQAKEEIRSLDGRYVIGDYATRDNCPKYVQETEVIAILNKLIAESEEK